jgi:hypothetical protein
MFCHNLISTDCHIGVCISFDFKIFEFWILNVISQEAVDIIDYHPVNDLILYTLISSRYIMRQCM